MYIFSMVNEIRKVIEKLRQEKGDFTLAMTYGDSLEAESGWNIIVSAPWADRLGPSAATRLVVERMHEILDSDARRSIARVTVLRTTDPFVRQMVTLYSYPVQGPGGGIPIPNLTAADREGAGFLFYAKAA